MHIRPLLIQKPFFFQKIFYIFYKFPIKLGGNVQIVENNIYQVVVLWCFVAPSGGFPPDVQNFVDNFCVKVHKPDHLIYVKEGYA